MAIYSAPDYSMGKDEVMQSVTSAERARAEVELRKMKKALTGWLKFRRLNNEVAAGRAKAKVPPGLAKKMIESGRDWGLERKLARQLHVLLAEVFDASQLPEPDIRRDPDAAVKLAEIAISGKLPSEAPSPEAQGLIWLWPAAIVVGLVLFTIVFKIKSDADLAMEKERELSIRSGARTDYGFWLKAASVVAIAWLAWDKFGLREAAGRLKRKGGGAH